MHWLDRLGTIVPDKIGLTPDSQTQARGRHKRLLLLSTVLIWPRIDALALNDSAGPYPWSRHGPVVGTVNGLVIAPSSPAIHYAGILSNSGGYGDTSNSGIYKSTDNGVSWAKRGLTGKRINALAVDPQNANTVYVGTALGVYKSKDGGDTWNGPYLGASREVQALKIDPARPAVLYGSVSGEGLYKSSDGGLTWISINNGIQYYGIHDLAIDAGNTNTIYAAAGYNSIGSIYKSTDGGATWKSSGTGIPDSSDDVATIALSQSNPSILYAGKGNVVYKSVDAGQSWNATGVGSLNSVVISLAVDPTNPSVVLAGTHIRGVYRTTDGGASWNSTSISGLGVRAVILEAGNPSRSYAGTEGSGILRSTDGGMNWSAASNAPYADVRELAAHPTNSRILYANASDGVYKTSDSGVSWLNALNSYIAEAPGVPAHKVTVSPTNPAVLYAASDFGGVYKTVDSGATWKAVYLANTNIRALAIDPSNAQNVYMATYPFHLHKSTDGGATWPKIASPGDVFVMAVDPKDSGTIYAGTSVGVHKSIDGGVSWAITGLRNSGSLDPVISLVLDSTNPSTLYAARRSGGAFRSVDGGVTWDAVFSDVGGRVLAFALDPRTAGTVFVGTDQGVYRSVDGGLNSTNLSAGLPGSAEPIMSLSYDWRGGTLYAGTQEGVFALRLGGNQASVDIRMSKDSYVPGDMVTVSEFRFRNPRASAATIEVKVWFEMPGQTPVSILNLGSDGTFGLPAAFDEDIGPFELFRVAPGSGAGPYSLNSRVLDPVTGETLSESLNPFTVQTQAAVMLADMHEAGPLGRESGESRRMEFSAESTAFSPAATVVMSKTAYSSGDAVTATEYRLKNTGSGAGRIEIKSWLARPNGNTISVINVGADGSALLAANLDVNLGPVILFAVTSSTEGGRYSFNVRLVEPTTGAQYSVNEGPFEIH